MFAFSSLYHTNKGYQKSILLGDVFTLGTLFDSPIILMLGVTFIAHSAINGPHCELSNQ